MGNRIYKPTKGRAIVQFQEEFADVAESGLVLPEMVSDRRDSVGVVMAINHSAAAAATVLVGDTVIVPPYVAGYKMGDSKEIINIEDIQAVVECEGDVTAGMKQDVPRCKYCGPADASVSTNGMMLEYIGPNAVLGCTRCNRDVNGMQISDVPKISDEETHDFKRDIGIEE